MDTRDRILDSAEALIQERGFSGFSFQDLALQVGIRKASIYYYFPAKADLGVALITRYRERMSVAFAAIDGGAIDVWAALTAYMVPMVNFGRSDGKACLAGVLAGEFLALPENMQTELTQFFEEHEVFIAKLLDRGRRDGAFHFEGTAKAMARMMLSAVEGALLIKRIKGDRSYFDGIVADFMTQLKGKSVVTRKQAAKR
jgi:TetR/AcrR family transcriptional regulator, transcriptional repressor for nem operon